MCDSKPCSSRVSFYKMIEKNVEKLISKQVEKLDVSILELINELVFGESVERLNNVVGHFVKFVRSDFSRPHLHPPSFSVVIFCLI